MIIMIIVIVVITMMIIIIILIIITLIIVILIIIILIIIILIIIILIIISSIVQKNIFRLTFSYSINFSPSHSPLEFGSCERTDVWAQYTESYVTSHSQISALCLALSY